VFKHPFGDFFSIVYEHGSIKEHDMFQTLRTLTRATWASADEELEARNAPTILTQHLRDARRGLTAARGRIAALMAQRVAEERHVKSLTDHLAQRRAEGCRAVQRREDELAEEIAEDMVALEEEKAKAAELAACLASDIDRLRRAADKADRQIQGLAADLRSAQSADRIRKIESAGVVRAIDSDEASALARAQGVAERLVARDLQRADLAKAMTTLRAETSLDDRIRSAGLSDKANQRKVDILASFEGDEK